MLPIGGLGRNTWTMDVNEALEAVKLIRPRRVIPCHYSIPLFWKRRFAVADDQRFKREAERLGRPLIERARGPWGLEGVRAWGLGAAPRAPTIPWFNM